MKIPRDLSGQDLVRLLCRDWAYRIVHQEGSHIILETDTPSHQRIAVPDHKNLRVGTLSAILKSVAAHIYRHAHAVGLDTLRRQNVRWVVEQFIEQWRNVKVTSSTIIRSIRALSCLDDKGRWTDLPKTHILRRAPDVPTATGLVEDAQNGAFTSSTAEFATPSSFEPSEPMHRKGTALAVPNRMPTTGVLTPEANVLENGDVPFSSSERSEPVDGRDSGLAENDIEPQTSNFQNLIESTREIKTCRNSLKTKEGRHF